MVSAAEQLAANLNFSALAKAEELKNRIWFTVGALLVYRLGTFHDLRYLHGFKNKGTPCNYDMQMPKAAFLQ